MWRVGFRVSCRLTWKAWVSASVGLVLSLLAHFVGAALVPMGVPKGSGDQDCGRPAWHRHFKTTVLHFGFRVSGRLAGMDWRSTTLGLLWFADLALRIRLISCKRWAGSFHEFSLAIVWCNFTTCGAFSLPCFKAGLQSEIDRRQGRKRGIDRREGHTG